MRVTETARRLCATLLLALALGGLSAAQAPSPALRQEIESAIKAQARQDAAKEKQRDPGHVIDMFRDAAAAAGIAPNEIVNLYEKEYAEASAAQPWWKDLSPRWGWLAAGIMLVLLVFRDVLAETLNNAVKGLKEWVYKRISGYRLFRRTALRHYRQALVRRYHRLKIPFRPDQPLAVRDIYVPLKVRGSSDAEQVDAFKTMAVTRRMMVVGPPGSGKSMLLKHVSLSYADGKFTQLPERPIPILLELNRLHDGTKSVEEHLVAALDVNDFHNARDFVELALKGGTLMLLFDGLDEVNSSRRDEVVKAITDLLLKYPACRVIITCRTAVYRNEFTEVTDQTLEIVEFTDQQVQRFLSAWQPYMPAGKSIEQLVNTLQARPRIMALARNPLLLTIIAFLYTDTEFVLPDSRTEFYDQAIDVLLRQWKVEANRFKAPHKRIVLQHLALFNQEGSAERGHDRRSIDLQTIIAEIKEVLPALNLEPKEADPLLDEIVERSGLLLPVDGGAKFQFAHLTLQEFFAATALGSDGPGLLKRFLQDPDAWRETVKLWCGLEQDSTKLVESIFAHDPVTAFECLADAQKISPALADDILNHFKHQLEHDEELDEAVVRAFAAVASGQSPRSQAVFRYLAGIVSLTGYEIRRGVTTRQGVPVCPDAACSGAIHALALTNRPEAISELLKYYDLWPEVRDAVVKMGDLAVKGLSELLENASDAFEGRHAVKGLRDIATPKAATALVPLLWIPEPGYALSVYAWMAARGLSALFGQPAVLDALRQYRLTPAQKASPKYAFVWAPFAGDAGTSLPVIAARCAEVLAELLHGLPEHSLLTDSAGLANWGAADLRLIVPTIICDEGFAKLRAIPDGKYEERRLVITGRGEGARSEVTAEYWRGAFHDYRPSTAVSRQTNPEALDKGHVASYLFAVFREHDSPTYTLLSLLRPVEQLEVFSRLFSSPRPTPKDWVGVTRLDTYSFAGSWQHLTAVCLLCLASLVWFGVILYSEDAWLNPLTLILLSVFAAGAASLVIWGRLEERRRRNPLKGLLKGAG